MAEKVPKAVAALRAEHLQNIRATRTKFGLNYEIANTILYSIMQLFYQTTKMSIIAENNATFNVVDPAIRERIHNEMVSILDSFMGITIPLRVIFGMAAANAAVRPIIMAIFGDDRMDKRQAFFRDILKTKEEWFNKFFGQKPPKLGIHFSAYGDKPAIELINLGGSDYVQYHITVSHDRVQTDPENNGAELVRGYHFTNWFYGNGTNRQRTFYFNNGSKSASMNAAKKTRRNERAYEAAAAAAEGGAVAVAAAAAAAVQANNETVEIGAAGPRLTQKEREAEQAFLKRQRLREKQLAQEKGISEEQLKADEALIEKIIADNRAAAAAAAPAAAAGGAAASAGGGGGGILHLFRMPHDYKPKPIIQYVAESRTADETMMFLTLQKAKENIREYFYKIMNPYKERSGLEESMVELVNIISKLKNYVSSEILTIEVLMPYLEQVNAEINTLMKLRKNIEDSSIRSANEKKQATMQILREIQLAGGLVKSLMLDTYLSDLRKGITAKEIINTAKAEDIEFKRQMGWLGGGTRRRSRTYLVRRTRQASPGR